jgi:hypothetical protein
MFGSESVKFEIDSTRTMRTIFVYYPDRKFTVNGASVARKTVAKQSTVPDSCFPSRRGKRKKKKNLIVKKLNFSRPLVTSIVFIIIFIIASTEVNEG